MNTAAVAVAVGVLVGAALWCAHRAFAPPSTSSSPARARSVPAVPTERIVAAAVVAFVVLLVTRWVAAAGVAAALTLWWREVMLDTRADDDRRRVEAIAKWLEDLRDTLRGSSMGAEEALEHVAERPPEAIREPLATYLFRRRQGFRTEDALTDLADSLAHPTSDAAVAAIQLVVAGSTGAGRLFHTVSSLAAAARDEVRARERIDRTRATYQRSMRGLVVLGVVLVAVVKLLSGRLLDVYAEPAGQLFLVVPLGMWASCIMWLRRLCRYTDPARSRPARRHAAVTA